MEATFSWPQLLHALNYALFLAAAFILWYWRRIPPWSSSRAVSRQSLLSQRRVRRQCHANYSFFCQSESVELRRNDVDLLGESNPSSTIQERQRFLRARNGCVDQASAGLRNYLQWRSSHWKLNTRSGGTVDQTSDIDDWNRATEAAIRALEPSIIIGKHPRLPRIARMHVVNGRTFRDLKRSRIIQIIPGQMDERVVSLETFALAVALYIDIKLDRESLEKVTVLIDARGGKGWRNLNAVQLIPFIRHTSQLLLTLFPERLAHAQVYPVPYTLGWVWRAVSTCIDPLTRDKISLLTGPARIISPPPVQQMEMYIEPEVVRSLEKARVDEFKEDRHTSDRPISNTDVGQHGEAINPSPRFRGCYE